MVSKLKTGRKKELAKLKKSITNGYFDLFDCKGERGPKLTVAFVNMLTYFSLGI